MIEKKPSEYISEFLNFITAVQKSYPFCVEEMKTQEKLTQDYLHCLELDGLKCDERSKIATKLMINRKDRRYWKDRSEELEPIVNFCADPQNKKVLDKLTQVLGACRTQEKRHQDRIYIPRVLKETDKCEK
jgi:hypothetical protein